MDSFSKWTLTKSLRNYWSSIFNVSFRVFRGRNAGDGCCCNFFFSQTIVSMWLLVISVLVLVPFSYGNTLPVPVPAHYSNEWSPKQDSGISYNYNAPNYRESGSVVSIPTYSIRAPQNQVYQNQPQERVVSVSTLPEPKPRHDELKEKLGTINCSLTTHLPINN